ncbi:MAG: SCO1664 family protein [Dehalococcoidia bacterium]|nr:SCO1664 family protein [Dehalococcoidia bacterium]
MTWDPFRPDIESLLRRARVSRCDMLPEGSNYAFLLTLVDQEQGESQAVYKPRDGETPLMDFPSGTLYQRECAAYVLSKALGWPSIPPTVVREGPYGIGSVQLYIDADSEGHYFTFRERRLPELRRVALFDVLANNADRKGGHCLEGKDGRVWCIDHGLTFHASYKLRTVIWDFCDEPVPPGLLADLRTLRPRLESPDSLASALMELLTPEEVRALRRRLDFLLEKGAYPSPGPERHFPWPLV